MKLWLDDLREPWKHGALGFVWAKSAAEAITHLTTGLVTFASLDHDLTPEQMIKGGFNGEVYDDGEGTGYDVVCWMEKNGVWPVNGVRVHSANPKGRARMQVVVDRHYEPQVVDAEHAAEKP